jgi:type II secretory pathway pseudopilin PulG
MRLRLPLTSQVGVSLMETMAALVVIVIGLSALQQAFPQGLAMRRQAMERTQATLLARGQLEQLRLSDFHTLTTYATTTPEPFLDSQQQAIPEPFRWQAEVVPVATDILEVRMQVVWPWPRPRHQLQLATYVGKY